MTNIPYIATPGRILKDALRKACRAHHAFEQWRRQNGHDLSKQPSKADCETFLSAFDPSTLAAVRAAANMPAPVTPAPVTVKDDSPMPADAPAPVNPFEAATASEDTFAPVIHEPSQVIDVEAIFDPVAPFVASSILAALRDRATQAIDHARREGEHAGAARAVSNVIALPARADGSPVIAPHASGKADFGSLVKRKPLNGLITATVSPGSFPPPPVDADYQFPAVATRALISAINRGRNVWLTGPRGTGKTTWCEQFAARTGRRFVRIGFHKYIEPAALIGGKGLRDGATVFEDGQLTAAVRVPFTVVLCDEPDLAPPAVLAFLQSAIDLRSISIPETGEVVPFAPGVVIAFASNTGGNGDETGLYSGTVEQNAALQDRFAAIVPFGYLPPEREALTLGARLGIDADRVRPFADFAALTRADVISGRNGDAVSYRALAAWCEALLDGIEPGDAFAWTVLAKMRPAFAARILELYRADFNEPAAVAVLAGRPVPVAPSKAGASFPPADTSGDNLLS